MLTNKFSTTFNFFISLKIKSLNLLFAFQKKKKAFPKLSEDFARLCLKLKMIKFFLSCLSYLVEAQNGKTLAFIFREFLNQSFSPKI